MVKKRKMMKEMTEKQIRKDLLKIDAIMEEVEQDPKVAEQAEENQRRYGTLTS